MVDGKDLGSPTSRPRQADTNTPSPIPGPVEAEDISFPEVVELNEIEPQETTLPGDEGDGEPHPGEPELPEETYFLPPGFNQTKIVLQVRDPEWVHAYWEIAEFTWRDVAASTHAAWSPKSAPRLLRVYDLGRGDGPGEAAQATRSFDIPIDHTANNWYINVGEPAKRYFVELGVLSPDGSFLPLCRSNVVVTPPGRPSDVIDLDWMTIEEGLLAVARPTPGASPGAEREWFGRIGRERELASPGIISSPGMEWKRPAEKGEWGKRPLILETGCDLVVYGRTDPAAVTTFNGRVLDVAPDGTFSVRVSLPEGIHQVEVEASLPETEPGRVRTCFEVSRRAPAERGT